MGREVAISLDGARKSYGSRKKRLPVLLGLDMTVERGTIYGLLGKDSFAAEPSLVRMNAFCMVFQVPPGAARPRCSSASSGS